MLKIAKCNPSLPFRWTGKCDPYSKDMADWLVTKKLTRKLKNYEPMIVF